MRKTMQTTTSRASGTARQHAGRTAPADALQQDLDALDAAVSERDLQTAIIAAARLLGWRVYHTWAAIHSPQGFPDLCLARAGRLIFAELKSARGRVRPEQAAWLRELSMVPHAETYLWRPRDWRDGSIETVLR